VQFTFGVWREQQLRQQRNASRKSGRLLALLNAPVKITSDDCVNCFTADEVPQISGGDSSSDSSASDYGSDDNNCTFSFRRKVHLRWPSVYTYCMQHVLSDCCEGFYCPPLPAVTAGEPDEDRESVYAIGSREEKAAIQQWLLGSSLDLNRWLCFYKPIPRSEIADTDHYHEPVQGVHRLEMRKRKSSVGGEGT